MRVASGYRQYFVSRLAALTLLGATLPCRAVDVYDPASHRLAIPALGIGSATFYNVSLSVSMPPVSGPAGSIPQGTRDSYDPASHRLFIPAVRVGTVTYYNVTVGVDQLASIGSVSGADAFDGAFLLLRNVRVVGGQSYHDVTVRVEPSDVVAVLGGMPSAAVDQYDGSAGRLTVPAVQYGGTVYTNVVLNAGLGDVVAVAGYVESLPYGFTGGTDGGVPEFSGLVIDAAGNLYGATAAGGSANNGTVFRLTANGGSGYTESVLYSFQGGSDGAGPIGSLVRDAQGNLYGTTLFGGSDDNGTVFRLAPNGAGGYTETVLHRFQGGADGSGPLAGLTTDPSGALYGTTSGGDAANSYGTVFRLAPIGNGLYSWAVLYRFRGGTDGMGPAAGVLIDGKGNLFGTTAGGDTLTDNGTVFRLTPNGTGGYVESVVYRFQGGQDGAAPFGGLVIDPSGTLYGTTTDFGYVGGVAGQVGNGTVFRLVPGGSGYRKDILYRFRGGTDGAVPLATLVIDAGGTLYGTTSGMGYANGQFAIFNNGTVFALTPNGNGSYAESVLHYFQGGSMDGANPEAGVTLDAGGNLFGTAGVTSGASTAGYVFLIH